MRQSRFPGLILAFTFLATLSSCLIGIRLPIIGGIGVGVRSDSATELAELEQSGIRVDFHSIEVDVDERLGYTAIIELRQTVLAPAGLILAQSAAMTIDPESQTLALVEARVTQPDGRSIVLGSGHVFEVPSTASRQSPGFVKTSTTTVVFPQLVVGSQTSVKWRLRTQTGTKLGLNGMYRPHLRFPVTEARVTMRYPKSVELNFAHRGDFEVTRTDLGDRHSVSAVLSDYPGHMPEAEMVSPQDVTPVVVVSSMGSWTEVGQIFGETVEPKVQVTPAVAAIAESVAGRLEGREAANALYNWVCRNMQYVVTYLNTSDTWVPHDVEQILINRYGDCKDHYVLLASLFAAKDLRIEPVLVGWDRSYEVLPLWTPQQFDHCIAYLPDFDLYVNPTDPYHDMGQLDVMLSGKFVVHAGAEPRVARTPWGRADDNSYAVTNKVSIQENGDIAGSSSLQFRGRVSGTMRTVMAKDVKEFQADNLLMASPGGGIGVFETSDPTDLGTPFEMHGSWQSAGALEMGERVFFSTPRGLDLVTPNRLQAFISARERRFPQVGRALELTWRHEIEPPAGYRFGVLPKARQSEGEFGSYTSTYQVDEDGRLHVERRLRMHKDLIPAEEYPIFGGMLRAAVQDLRATLILERITP